MRQDMTVDVHQLYADAVWENLF